MSLAHFSSSCRLSVSIWKATFLHILTENLPFLYPIHGLFQGYSDYDEIYKLLELEEFFSINKNVSDASQREGKIYSKIFRVFHF